MKRKITNKNLIHLLSQMSNFSKGLDPFFRKQARERLLSRISPVKRNFVLPKMNFHPLIWKQFTAVSFKYGLSIFLCIVLLGSGTVLAAQSSLPASVLYPVKKATEKVFLTASKAFSRQTQVEQMIVNERFEEVQKLEELMKKTAKDYHDSVKRFEGVDPQFKKETRGQVIKQKAILEQKQIIKNPQNDKENKIQINNSGNNSGNTKWERENGGEAQLNKGEEKQEMKEKPVSNDKPQGNSVEEKRQNNPEPQNNKDKSPQDSKK